MNERLHRPLGVLIRAALITLGLCGSSTITRADTFTFTDVMRRAHQYAVLYEDHELSTVVARERYQQQWRDAQAQTKAERTLISDYALFQLPPSEDWFALRDVYEVDGVPVTDREARLAELFNRPRHLQAMEIMKESGRFNLAPDVYYRTVNVPTFAIRFLRPASRSRMEFKKLGEEDVEGVLTWVVDYQEIKGPTFVATPEGRELRAHGRFWIAPDTGAVMRSEMIVGGTRHTSARVTITVTYRHDAALGFMVPIEMLERYDNPRRDEDDVVLAHATYSEFRPFDWHALVRPSN